MFERSQLYKPPYPGAKVNRLAKYIRDHFVRIFVEQESMKNGDVVPDALRRSFLKTNRSLIQAMRKSVKNLKHRKNLVPLMEEHFPFPVDGATMESGEDV
ncbi:hypothetical protein H0H92_012498, partial [Tricholoma furcatifolium]